MAGVKGSGSEPAVPISSTRNTEGFCMVVSSGCDLETPLAPGLWWLVEPDIVARWNWFWEVFGAYKTGVRMGNSSSSAEDR